MWRLSYKDLVNVTSSKQYSKTDLYSPFCHCSGAISPLLILLLARLPNQVCNPIKSNFKVSVTYIHNLSTIKDNAMASNTWLNLE